MKISLKIALGFGILAVLVWVIGIFSITSFSRSSTLFNNMDTDTIPKLITVGEMSQKVTEAHVEFMEFLLSGKISSRDNVTALNSSLATLAGEHLKHITQQDAAEKEVAGELVEKVNLFSSSVVDVMDMKTRGLSDEDLLSAEEKKVRPIFDTIMNLLSQQNGIYKSELSVVREDIKASQSQGQLVIIIIAVIAMIAGIILSILTERRIVQPILHLTRAAEDISKGDISKPVVKESSDEIGELADAFERMRVSLKVMIEEEG